MFSRSSPEDITRLTTRQFGDLFFFFSYDDVQQYEVPLTPRHARHDRRTRIISELLSLRSFPRFCLIVMPCSHTQQEGLR